jgi:hypothetical protein
MAEITEDLSGKLTQQEPCNGVSHPLTPSPSHSEGEASTPKGNDDQPVTPTSQKKKKKKKAKKSAKAKEAATPAAKTQAGDMDSNRPPVLCISRNKHWRYISSYHVRGCFLLLFFFY